MSRKLVLATVTMTCVLGFFGLLFLTKGSIHMNTTKAYRLDEPLLIEGEKQNGYSLLPQGTVLYYDRSWDEGHSTYHVYFNFKGEFRSTPLENSGVDPIWLRTVPAEELPKLLADYPVSLHELTAILKAKRATKQDLVQILRDWKD